MAWSRLKALLAERPEPTHPFVDASAFGDPVALRTGWGPAKKGGSNFTTHRLVERGPGRLEFRATGGMIAFASLFLLIGLAFLLVPGPGSTRDLLVGRASAEDWAILLGGTLFAAAGAGMMWWALRPRVFDRGAGLFWRGLRPRADPSVGGGKASCALAQIHAIQMLREHVRGSRNTYWSYELNLVLHDGRRISVVDHGNFRQLEADAALLGSWLGCPVWDAASEGQKPTP